MSLVYKGQNLYIDSTPIKSIAKKRKINLFNVPNISTRSVAEFGFGYLCGECRTGKTITVLKVIGDLAKENVLFNNPKAILTPHIAASTSEASIVVAEMVANQLSDFLLNGVKKNTV